MISSSYDRKITLFNITEAFKRGRGNIKRKKMVKNDAL